MANFPERGEPIPQCGDILLMAGTYPINSLVGIKPDASDLVALPLHRDVEPVLLLHGVALPVVLPLR
jgi:hypothetical protein